MVVQSAGAVLVVAVLGMTCLVGGLLLSSLRLAGYLADVSPWVGLGLVLSGWVCVLVLHTSRPA